MTAALLELKEIDGYYGPIQALKQVSLHINEAETVSLNLVDAASGAAKGKQE